MTRREQCLSALFALVSSVLASRVPPPRVARNESVPQVVPAGGLVSVNDGETEAATAILSPLHYEVRHRADVEIVVGGQTEAARASALDELIEAIASGVASDRTLSGVATWLEVGAPEVQTIATEGARPLKAASLPIVIHYGSAGMPF